MPRTKTAPKPTPKPVAPQLDLALLSEWQPVAGVVAATLAGNAGAALAGLRALPAGSLDALRTLAPGVWRALHRLAYEAAGDGATADDVAAQLGVSVATVTLHRTQDAAIPRGKAGRPRAKSKAGE